MNGFRHKSNTCWTQTANLTRNTKFLECPDQESHSKFSVANQKDEGLWEDLSNDGIKL